MEVEKGTRSYKSPYEVKARPTVAPLKLDDLHLALASSE